MNLEVEQKAINKWISLRASAENRGKEFSLTVADVRKLIQQKRCFYTGNILREDNRSVDRVDNDLGYVKGNVVACETRINTAKNNLSFSEILLMAERIRELDK